MYVDDVTLWLLDCFDRRALIPVGVCVRVCVCEREKKKQTGAASALRAKAGVTGSRRGKTGRGAGSGLPLVTQHVVLQSTI